MELKSSRLGALRDRLAAYCGVYLDDTRSAALELAIRQRARLASVTPERYPELLLGDSGKVELRQLAELLLNHETQFYRNKPHMHALQHTILPELHRRLPPGAPLRLWSAGCATGEEPYSLAIAAFEALGDPLPRPVEIWATDLSEPALERARAGVYRGRSLANLTLRQRARYFSAQGDALQLAEPVRRLVRFEQLNLLEAFPPTARGMHTIFCQNVTIYFQVSTCRALMERFHLHMADGGYLFLGFSETLWNIFDRFRWREVADAYVYYKESQPAAQPFATSPRRDSASQPTPRRSHRATPSSGPVAAPELVARGRALLDAGRADEALEIFSGAPLGGVDAPQILALAARAHADRGDLDLAAAEARRALELNPHTTEAHLLIGLIHARQGRPDAAIGRLERAKLLAGDAPAISFHLAECYRQTGLRDAALREYRATIRHLTEHPPDRLIDGVAAGWLSETCRHYETILSGDGQ